MRADHRRDLADTAKEQELALAQATFERNQQQKENEARENELHATVASLVMSILLKNPLCKSQLQQEQISTLQKQLHESAERQPAPVASISFKVETLR